MDQIKNNTIAVYILSREENYWAEFRQVHVRNEDIQAVDNGESESLIVHTKGDEYNDNYRIYQRIKKSVLWLSTKPGDIVETDYAMFWLPEPNYDEAYNIIMTKCLKGN